MFGCCGCSQEKFVSKQGDVDQVRLDQIVARLHTEGWSQKEVEKVQKCDCPCHQDGAVCLC